MHTVQEHAENVASNVVAVMAANGMEYTDEAELYIRKWTSVQLDVVVNEIISDFNEAVAEHVKKTLGAQ